ncbi:MAG: hypothetical protein AAF502_23400 [Bacteroidota bacterium]
MSLRNRNTLKNFFKRGSYPTEVNFSDLIDSTVNKVDDGFSMNADYGMMLSPQGASRKLLSFYENMRDKNPAWGLILNPDNRASGLSFEEEGGESRMFIQKGGNVGVGTTSPLYKLDVRGMAGMAGRIGTFATGQVLGDGKWHSIVSNLNGNHAFEVIAQISGIKGRGRYAMTHATCLSNYGGGRHSIKTNKAYYRWFWNKIDVRFKGSTFNYDLQVRTWSNYGTGLDDLPRMIVYRVCKLWDQSDEQSQMYNQPEELDANQVTDAHEVKQTVIEETEVNL